MLTHFTLATALEYASTWRRFSLEFPPESLALLRGLAFYRGADDPLVNRFNRLIARIEDWHGTLEDISDDYEMFTYGSFSIDLHHIDAITERFRRFFISLNACEIPFAISVGAVEECDERTRELDSIMNPDREAFRYGLRPVLWYR